MSEHDAPIPPASPPTYAGTQTLDILRVSAPGAELPSYAPSLREPSIRSRRHEDQIKEFENDIKRKGKTLVSMTILADASFSKHVPTFLEGSPVKGRVCLNLDKPDTFYSIVVSIRGTIIPGADPNQHQTFLNVWKTLWSAEQGVPPRNNNPNNPSISHVNSHVDSSNTSASSAGTGAKSGVKLQGEFVWNFAIELPKQVAVPHGRQKQIELFNLPQTFIERQARASIAYEILVRFVRGKWQTDYRIPVTFGYIPLSGPPPFSTLRRLSYQENAPLLGPTVDIDGWHRVDPVDVNGTLFNDRAVNINCTLYLAKPLQYTRGSLIPLSVCLRSEDQQCLDLLVTSRAIVIRLQRRVQYHYDSVHTVGAHQLRDSIEHSDPAIMWPSNEGTEDHSKRIRFLNGELHLKADLKPSSAMADFFIEYTLMLLSFQAPGFEPAEVKPLVEQPVKIVTTYAAGPRPRKYAPPGYESESSAPKSFWS